MKHNQSFMDYNSILTLLHALLAWLFMLGETKKNICISCARQAQDPQVQPTAGGKIKPCKHQGGKVKVK